MCAVHNNITKIRFRYGVSGFSINRCTDKHKMSNRPATVISGGFGMSSRSSFSSSIQDVASHFNVQKSTPFPEQAEVTRCMLDVYK